MNLDARVVEQGSREVDFVESATVASSIVIAKPISRYAERLEFPNLEAVSGGHKFDYIRVTSILAASAEYVDENDSGSCSK